METLNINAYTLLEASFGKFLLGAYYDARCKRALGRQYCESNEEVAIYDIVSGEFMQDPDGFMTNIYKGDFEELIDFSHWVLTYG